MLKDAGSNLEDHNSSIHIFYLANSSLGQGLISQDYQSKALSVVVVSWILN